MTSSLTGDYVQVSRKRRLLLVTVQKGLVWPEDETLLLKMDIDRLPPVGEVLVQHLPSMFEDMEDLSRESVLETVRKQLLQRASGQWPTPEDPTEAALHMAQQIIQGLFANAWHKVSHSLEPRIPQRQLCMIHGHPYIFQYVYLWLGKRKDSRSETASRGYPVHGCQARHNLRFCRSSSEY